MYTIFHDNIYLTQTNVGTNVDSGVRRHMASMGYTDLHPYAYTVQCRYDAVNFLLWIQHVIDTLPQILYLSM